MSSRSAQLSPDRLAPSRHGTVSLRRARAANVTGGRGTLGRHRGSSEGVERVSRRAAPGAAISAAWTAPAYAVRPRRCGSSSPCGVRLAISRPASRLDPPVGEPVREHEHRAGEAVAAEVRGLPGLVRPGLVERGDQRAAHLGAAGVPATVGADQEQRVVMRLEARRATGGQRRPGRGRAAPPVGRAPRSRSTALRVGVLAKTRRASPRGARRCRRISCTRTPALAALGDSPCRTGSAKRLSSRALRPQGPAYSTRRYVAATPRCRPAARPSRDGAAEGRSSGAGDGHAQSPGSRRSGGAGEGGRVRRRAVPAAGRSRPPRCGPRRRAWPGCWRRGRSRSWH